MERNRTPSKKCISVSDGSKPSCLVFENCHRHCCITILVFPLTTQAIAQMDALSRYLLPGHRYYPRHVMHAAKIIIKCI